MNPTTTLPILALIALFAAAPAPAQVPSILNYQGRVTVGGTNFNGTGRFKFALVRNDNTFVWRNDGSTNSGEPAAAVDALVQQGLYSTLLGDTALSNMAAIPSEVFTNSNIGLRVWFSAGGTNPFVLLTPDQRIASSGYAVRAATADSAAIGNVTGDLEVGGTLRVGKLIGGTNNAIAPEGTGAVIAGGEANTASLIYSTIGGGYGNTNSAQYATIAGGQLNAANNNHTVIGGGRANAAMNTFATIGGGYLNTNSGQAATIGGGLLNKSSGYISTIGGGRQNTASNGFATVSGGYANTASGEGSTVPGGQYNTAAGTNSIAMGYRAKATNDGAFVWADSSADEDFSSTTNNQFSVRAAGGVRFVTGGAGISIDGTRVVTETGLSNITSDIGLSGALRIAGGNPGPGRVLVSDANGYVSWRPLEEVAAMNQYTYTPQPFTENIAEIGISGVLTNNINVSVVNGPGFVVERVVGGNPYQLGTDYPGLSREMDFVFDYSGPMETALAAWQASGNTATITLPAKEFGSPVYTWTLSNYRLSTINPAPSGGKRYTLVHAGSPDGTLDAVRDNSWRDALSVGPAGVPLMEIEGVIQGLYPEPVVVDQAQKTITITATYGNGGQLFMWAKAIAQQSPELKAGALIYQNWSTGLLNRRELGRNIFFGLFPISYQQISGFTPGTLGKERLVLAYGSAENGTTIGPALYAPPETKFYAAEGGDMLTRDGNANRFYIEIEGVSQASSSNPSEWPILIEGPGFTTERFGTSAASSGVTGLYPLVFDVPTGGQMNREIAQWRQSDLQNNLPEDVDDRALSVMVSSNGVWGSEAYRCNVFDVACKSIEELGDGYTRVTLATPKAPDNAPRAQMDGPWGNASINNPDTDTRMDISGLLTNFYPQLTDSTTNKTLTLYFDYGEGQSLHEWARDIAWEGTAIHGKKTVTAYGSGTTTTYSGCFPISWQLVSGVERAARGRQKVVLSYDSKSP